MKRTFSIGLLLGLVLAFVVISLMASNPHGCPPGQDDCKLVQHEVTGKTKCLPLQAVAPPWIIIGDCEVTPTDEPPVWTVQPSSTPFQPATATDIPATATVRATSTQVLPTSTRGTGGGSLSTSTPTAPVGSTCDYCALAQTEAAALSTIAASQATQAARP